MTRMLAVAALGAAAVVGIAAAGGAAGDERRGAVVWVEQGCGTCHTFRAAGSTGKAGPDVDRWLVPQALRAKLPVDRFALSRVLWGGRGMAGYGPQLSEEEVDDLVSFVLGRPFSAPPEGVPRAPGFDAPPELVTVSPAVARRWVKVAKLRGPAALGARLFAREGCLSCHRYLGSGQLRLGGGDLSSAGRKRGAAFLRAYVARPFRYGNTSMPMYLDLGKENLGRIAAFLAASRRGAKQQTG